MTAMSRLWRALGCWLLPASIVAVALIAASCAWAAVATDEDEREIRTLRLYDVLREIREHFRPRLVYGWYIEEPSRLLGGYEVRLHIPDWWRGNPASAAAGLCPDSRSEVWRGTPSLLIQPYYRNLPWAATECRARGQ